MDTIDISGLDKAKVLAGLYNNSQPLGMGFLQYDPSDMTENEAQQLLNQGVFDFDYLKGRVMKIDLSDNNLYTGLYDRDNSEGAAKAVIEKIRAEENVK